MLARTSVLGSGIRRPAARSMSMMPDDHLNAIVERLRSADNIPYVATTTPIVSELAASLPSHIHPDVLW